MKVHLVHHAEAVMPGVDAQRPLSDTGVRQAEWLAEAAQAAGIRPDVIWHSGKLRARQTAECFLRSCNPFATFVMVRGLRPEDPPDWIRDQLEGEEGEVLVTGHMPNIGQLALRLGAVDAIPIHGIVSFERTGARQYVERWRAQPPLSPPVRS
jgi:phosphohistidine phosphatase